MGEEKKIINIIIPQHLMSGSFSNIANLNISKNKDSIIIDFMFNSPSETILVSRVILSTDHAKSLEKVLSEVLKKI